MFPRFNAVDAPEMWAVLARSMVAVVVPADTTEDILAVVQLPAGLLGANGWLDVETMWSCTSSANTKTPRLRIGGPAGTELLNATITTSTAAIARATIAQQNSQASQRSMATLGTTNTFLITNNAGSVIDLSQASSLVISGQKQVGGETFTLLGYKVLFCTTP